MHSPCSRLQSLHQDMSVLRRLMREGLALMPTKIFRFANDFFFLKQTRVDPKISV